MGKRYIEVEACSGEEFEKHRQDIAPANGLVRSVLRLKGLPEDTSKEDDILPLFSSFSLAPVLEPRAVAESLLAAGKTVAVTGELDSALGEGGAGAGGGAAAGGKGRRGGRKGGAADESSSSSSSSSDAATAAAALAAERDPSIPTTADDVPVHAGAVGCGSGATLCSNVYIGVKTESSGYGKPNGE